MNSTPSRLATTLGLFFVFSIASSLQAQTFDESFELWPVDLKINGAVIASGGGQLPELAPEIFLRLAGRDEAKLLVWNAALQDPGDDPVVKQLRSLVPDLGVASLGANRPPATSEDNGDESVDLAPATGIAITGEQLSSTASKKLTSRYADLSSVIQRGGVVMTHGASTGAVGSLRTESFEHLTSIAPGANLIPDSVVIPNYDDQRDRGRLLAQLAVNPRLVGIGIPKNTAVVLRGRKMRVIGQQAVTFILMANEHKPLRVQHVSAAESTRVNPYEYIIDLTAWRRDAIERTTDPFPPSEPPTPHVENGTLLIVGGGGLPDGLMDKMVQLAGGKEAHMVYVPCSEADEVSPEQRIVEQWKRMGVASATTVHTKDRNKANSDDEFLQPLKQATGIWFGGGRQWNFADSYYGTEAHRLMKQVLQRGGVIGGSSAGASIQARYMCRANPVANLDIMAPGYERGLGFIGGVAIDQHFSARGRQKDMTQLANRYPQLLGIGIDEGTAIIVQKSVAEVIGADKVFFYDRLNRPVVPGEDDFIALQAGEKFDLAKREVIEDEAKEAKK